MGKLEDCFAFTIAQEGGAKYTNDPRDPGGPTKYGVTLKTLAEFTGNPDLTEIDVQALTEEHAAQIFRAGYYDPTHADLLPAPLALMLVDFAYNSGPRVACRKLQERLGVTADGSIGPRTAAVANALSAETMRSVINAYGAARLQYLQSLPTWGVFGNGWTNRVNACMAEAHKLIEGA